MSPVEEKDIQHADNINHKIDIMKDSSNFEMVVDHCFGKDILILKACYHSETMREDNALEVPSSILK
eukprot:7331618-Ditylum_brightwellii.AAC.3